MENMRYFEVNLSNENEKGCYPVCIKATHKPTKIEVKKFLDIKSFGYTKILEIREMTSEEARTCYDMENDLNFPLLQ